ncbi:protein PRRC2C-like [Penaeus indicus]|uniref:protein PRRC2C-like n=1 Tax=Penaeus indicus TaxID=29960 RepID=UPI00300D0A73
MWRVAAVAVACLLGGVGGAAAGHDGEGKITWAEVLGVPAPPVAEFEYEYDYDDDEGTAKNDARDDFFANHDYEYVDTADPSYMPPPPPPPEEEEEGGEKRAERRTLDLLYHWFLSDPKKPSRPSLIEEVFRTIDNHIIEDLREWNANAFPHLPKKPAIGAAHDHGARATKGTPAAAAQEDTLLVTDEQGREHVVTINDIVTSLGHLDEQTLTELLLGPPVPADKRSSVALPSPPALPQGTSLVPVLVPKPKPAFALQEKQQPLLLHALEAAPGELARPVRHTGPPTGAPTGPPKAAAALLAEQGDDVYVVQDEQGAVQVVTLQDILASLSALDSGSVNQLLFGQGQGVAPLLPLPSAVGQDAAAAAPVPLAVVPPNAASAANRLVKPSAATTPAPVPAPAPSSAPTPPPRAPSVSTDFDGNLHVRARPGSVAVDLRSHDWAARAAGHSKGPAGPAEGGSEGGAEGGLVRRDGNGDIHISPAPGRPFALDVHSIIALAEQAEQEAQAEAGKSVPSKSNQNRLAGSSAKGGEELPSRGQELLSFLAGVDALPTAIPPSPPPAPVPTVAPAVNNQLLLQALGRLQPTTPAPAPNPPASGGLGATLTGFLSRLVGGGAEQPVAPQVEAAVAPEPAPALTPQQEYIQLVLRQQKRHAVEDVFGDVVIPLPQPIHHRASPPAPAAPVKREAVDSGAQVESAEEEEPSTLLAGLSPRVLNTLRHQLQDVPHFVPPTLRRAAHAAAPSTQPAADARADDVPDNEIQRLATSPLESLASYASSFVPSPSPSPSPSSSVPQLLSKLPSESLRKLLLQALQKKSSAFAPDPPVVRAPRIPDKPQARSSYAELPDYSSIGGGYGGGYAYGHSGSSTTTAADENPLFDVYFLADATSLYKIGDTNLSLKTPKIGSPKNFVDTRHPFGYHYDDHHHHGYGHHQQGYGYPATYGYH